MTTPTPEERRANLAARIDRLRAEVLILDYQWEWCRAWRGLTSTAALAAVIRSTYALVPGFDGKPLHPRTTPRSLRAAFRFTVGQIVAHERALARTEAGR